MTSEPLDRRCSADSMATDWLVGARLVDIVRLLLFIQSDLTRRGVSFSWSIAQAGSAQTDASVGAEDRRTGA